MLWMYQRCLSFTACVYWEEELSNLVAVPIQLLRELHQISQQFACGTTKDISVSYTHLTLPTIYSV